MSMVVFSLSDCSPKLRGDLSKWLFELNTGVYVGKVSSRVRENLWDRVCENLSHGKATMVYSAKNEQGMEFRVFQTSWEPVDFDGVTLMRRPLPRVQSSQEASGFSNASRMLKAGSIQKARKKKEAEKGYVVIDLETTGLSPMKDEILEIGAVHIVSHEVKDSFSTLVKIKQRVPADIMALTGIREDAILREGRALKEALSLFLEFIEDKRMVFHNAGFDRGFLQKALAQCELPQLKNPYEDTMVLAKRYLEDIENYKLQTLVRELFQSEIQKHRALEDSILTWRVYEKLKEMERDF